MIFPTDYRQRLIKEEKSRQYKAMLDEQIRQNNLYSQQTKNHRRPARIKTQPRDIYSFSQPRHANPKQLAHETTFLPTINSSNAIDPRYKYTPPVIQNIDNSRISRSYGSKKYPKSYAGKTNDESDQQLQKCLQQCDDLIFGINKNFIRLHNHLGSNSLRRKSNQKKNIRNRNLSEFQILTHQDDAKTNQYPKLKYRPTQIYHVQDDVGRNQMMNYNLTKAREKELLYMSTPLQNRGDSSSVMKDKNNKSLNKSGRKSDKKSNNNDFKTPLHKRNHTDFDQITDQQNQFTQSPELDRSMMSNMSDSAIFDKLKKNQLSPKQLQKIQFHLEMKKKDTHIIEHLRKAKQRGNLLFKKIQVFKKQRQTLELKNQSQTKAEEHKTIESEQYEKQNNNKIGDKQLKKKDISLSNTKK